MIVLSDTTAISALTRIGYLHLLEQLFQEVIIPQKYLMSFRNYPDLVLTYRPSHRQIGLKYLHQNRLLYCRIYSIF